MVGLGDLRVVDGHLIPEMIAYATNSKVKSNLSVVVPSQITVSLVHPIKNKTGTVPTEEKAIRWELIPISVFTNVSVRIRKLQGGLNQI